MQNTLQLGEVINQSSIREEPLVYRIPGASYLAALVRVPPGQR
jgi:hypothetical protein